MRPLFVHDHWFRRACLDRHWQNYAEYWTMDDRSNTMIWNVNDAEKYLLDDIHCNSHDRSMMILCAIAEIKMVWKSWLLESIQFHTFANELGARSRLYDLRDDENVKKLSECPPKPFRVWPKETKVFIGYAHPKTTSVILPKVCWEWNGDCRVIVGSDISDEWWRCRPVLVGGDDDVELVSLRFDVCDW